MRFFTKNTSLSLANTTLNSLMQLYKGNYTKLNSLVDLFSLKNTLLLHSLTSKVVIEVELLERVKHTTTARMNYLFEDSNKDTKILNAEIRIYYDTQQAEILRIQNKERFDSFF